MSRPPIATAAGNGNNNSSSSIINRFSALFRRNSIPSAVGDQDPANKGTAIVVSRAKTGSGEFPQLTMAQLMSYYFTNNKVKTVADTIALQIKARRYYWNTKSVKARKALQDFDRNARLGNIIDCWVREGVVTGNSFTEMLAPDDLQGLSQVPIESIHTIERNPDGSLKTIVQLIDGQKQALRPERFIQYKLFDVGRRPFACGLIHALAMPQIIDGEVRPSVLANYGMMRDALVRTIERHASPIVHAYYEGASDEFLQTEAQKIKDAKNGDIYASNRKSEWQEISIDPRARYEGYIHFITKDFESGLMHPVIRLLTEPSALADAQAAAEIMEPFLFGIEDGIKELIDQQIIPRVLEANGLSNVEAEFAWGMEDSADIEMADLWAAVNAKQQILKPHEIRRIVREKFHWPLDENNELDQDIPEIEKAAAVPPGQMPAKEGEDGAGEGQPEDMEEARQRKEEAQMRRDYQKARLQLVQLLHKKAESVN